MSIQDEVKPHILHVVACPKSYFTTDLCISVGEDSDFIEESSRLSWVGTHHPGLS